MPSDDDIQNLHVIIFEDAGEAEKIQQFIRKYALVASREVGERAHYHCAIHRPEVEKRKTFINMMKSQINKDMKGTKHFKTINWNSYGIDTSLEQYICKGTGPDWKQEGPEMITSGQLITPEMHHRAYWDINKKIPDIAKEKAKQAKKKGTECIKEIALKYKGCEDTIKHQIVIEDVMDFYEGRCQDNQMFPIIQAIMYKVNARQTKDLAVNRLTRKFFD